MYNFYASKYSIDNFTTFQGIVTMIATLKPIPIHDHFKFQNAKLQMTLIRFAFNSFIGENGSIQA